MSDDPKDKTLTRIEDLGEYLHDFSSDEDESPPEFETKTDDSSFEAPTFESNEFGATDFESSSEEVSSDYEEPQFGASFEEATFEEPTFSVEEEAPAPAEDEPEEKKPEQTKAEEGDLNPIDEPVFIPEPVADVVTPSPEPTSAYKAPENFEEVKKFAESTSFTGIGVEGNPSFSVLLKSIRYVEDVNDIISLLRELNLLTDGEEQTRARLLRGHLLVPRISEYAAIFLAHKLRRFDIDIQLGLSDEIHPPKHHEAPELGLVSKSSLYQNQGHHFKFDDTKLVLSQIIVAATPTLEGYQVVRYLGVASEHKMIEGEVVEDETSTEIPHHYHELADRLKAHALKAHANAVVGLNYQLTPLPSEFGHSGQKYRLSCTGNLVWVNRT